MVNCAANPWLVELGKLNQMQGRAWYFDVLLLIPGVLDLTKILIAVSLDAVIYFLGQGFDDDAARHVILEEIADNFESAICQRLYDEGKISVYSTDPEIAG